MILTLLRWVGYLTLVYFILMQAYMIWLGLRSAVIVRRARHLQRFGRVTDMLSSQTSPPVSIVIPAYNEATGIVDSVRSMSIVGYPRFEIVITNDGSTDETLQTLIDAFHLEKVRIPYRPDIPTAEVRAIYRGRGNVEITVIDKENGGRADALNAGINAARYPYALCTDADVILDADCLVSAMRRVVEDRQRTVAVGGNIRPLNGSQVRLGHLIRAEVPKGLVPRMQVLEYLRTFLASRPAWSSMEALPLVSGAFGIWKRSAVIAVGGFSSGHMGEDMDLTMRLHRHHMDNRIPYRIVYEPSAVIWTEVPDTHAGPQAPEGPLAPGPDDGGPGLHADDLQPPLREGGDDHLGRHVPLRVRGPDRRVRGMDHHPPRPAPRCLEHDVLGHPARPRLRSRAAQLPVALALDEGYGYFT